MTAPRLHLAVSRLPCVVATCFFRPSALLFFPTSTTRSVAGGRKCGAACVVATKSLALSLRKGTIMFTGLHAFETSRLNLLNRAKPLVLAWKWSQVNRGVRGTSDMKQHGRLRRARYCTCNHHLFESAPKLSAGSTRCGPSEVLARNATMYKIMPAQYTRWAAKVIWSRRPNHSPAQP
jgi:hypothetical protein